MKKNKIVGIEENIEDTKMMKVSFDIDGITKEAMYQKDSHQLNNCINRYLDILYKKSKSLEEQKEDEIFNKRLRTIILLSTGTLLLVAIIMAVTISYSSIVSLIGYILSIAIMISVFAYGKTITYHNSQKILDEIAKCENDILVAEAIRDKTKEEIKKNKDK